MSISNLLPILLGLGSAFFWGAGDFAGGMGSKRARSTLIVLAGQSLGLFILPLLLWLTGETRPPWPDLLFSILAGITGLIGLAILYRALAEGQMSIAAPVSALLAACIPVVVGIWQEGLPGTAPLIGFALALIAIWLISSNGEGGQFKKARLAGLRLPLLAGLAFGAYFVFMHAGGQHATLWPLLCARVASVVTMLAYLSLRRQLTPLPRTAWPFAAANGILDLSANALYILAGQSGRLDVAAVLGSLYPGMTVLLAWLLLKEHISRLQALGIVAALAAIALIAGG